MSRVAAILRAHETARVQKVQRKGTSSREHNEAVASKREFASFQRFVDEWDDNFTPDPLGKTGQYEPKSIYSPAPPSKLKFERPQRRKLGERNERDCELPADLRRHQVLNATNGNGKPTGTITVNPFNKTISITGPRFRSGQSVLEKRKAAK